MPPHSHDYVRRATRQLEKGQGTRASVTAATVAFDEHRLRAYGEVDAEAWRTWASEVKSHLLSHLDDYLEQAEQRLVENGAVVHWAPDAGAALAVLRRIVDDEGVRRVVKGKSMLSEELGVNDFLAELEVDVRETDLGEYIIQLLGEPPSHIVGPAIHRSVDDVRELFGRVLGTDLRADPDELASAARDALRQAFLSADMGITGANFLVAETGTIALIENEGNIRLSTSLPRIHVALIGIEKLLPRWDDLAGFLQLTARAATGQPIGNFVSLIQGPRRAHEPDGPDQVHVVLVDNGRSRMLADDQMWEALRCVRCGACLNVCPVYRQTGGHPYGWVYSGPIGSILAPSFLGMEEGLPLPYASSLCGACADACPVRIPIPELLLEWRKRAVNGGYAAAAERRALGVYTFAAERPSAFAAGGALLRAVPSAIRNALPMIRDWSQGRAPIEPSPKSFRRLFEEGID